MTNFWWPEKNCFFKILIGKPFPAAQIKVNCGHEDAFITWQSSYFGYEQQYSYVQYSTDNIKFVNGSDYIAEDNKQEILQITVSDLQDSSVYYFRVNTFNRYGLSSSMSTNCSTGQPKVSVFNHLILSLKSTTFMLVNFFDFGNEGIR